MNTNTIIWEKIKNKRDGYFIEYQPPRYDPDNNSYPLAVLLVVIVSQFSKDKIAQILESEFKTWATLYQVALLAMACDQMGKKVDLTSIRQSDEITGFYNPSDNQLTLYWGLLGNDQIPDFLKQNERLKRIYSDIPFKTEQQIREKLDRYYKDIRSGKRFILATVILWLLLPVAIEIWGISNPFISAGIIIYSVIKAAIALLKLLGILKPNTKELEKSEKERKMEHYFYHCEKNPEGFIRLRNENFEREAIENIKREYEDLN